MKILLDTRACIFYVSDNVMTRVRLANNILVYIIMLLFRSHSVYRQLKKLVKTNALINMVRHFPVLHFQVVHFQSPHSSMHRYECVALCGYISVQRGRFCAGSLASYIPRYSDDRSLSSSSSSSSSFICSNQLNKKTHAWSTREQEQDKKGTENWRLHFAHKKRKEKTNTLDIKTTTTTHTVKTQRNLRD